MASYPMEEITGKWVIETVMPDLAIMLKVDDVLYSGHTGYQRVEVVHSEVYGRSLLLDGKTQSTERDEHIYHETLVHPAMLLHPDPRRVFIGGGGEGGTLGKPWPTARWKRWSWSTWTSRLSSCAANTCPIITGERLMTGAPSWYLTTPAGISSPPTSRST